MSKKDIINIAWKPFFAAVMTGILTNATGIHPVLLGLGFGGAAAVSCYIELKKYVSEPIDDKITSSL